jgi:hypothetical protein
MLPDEYLNTPLPLYPSPKIRPWIRWAMYKRPWTPFNILLPWVTFGKNYIIIVSFK